MTVIILYYNIIQYNDRHLQFLRRPHNAQYNNYIVHCGDDVLPYVLVHVDVTAC